MIIFVDSRMLAMQDQQGRGHGNTSTPKKPKKKKKKKKQHMNQSPTNGHSCFPFAINCRLTKTFFGATTCFQCNKLILLRAGYACQFCRYRCHKKCRSSRPKLCSLSHLPTGDEELFNKVLKENEINSNDPGSIFHNSWSSALTVSTESGYPKPSCSSSEVRDSLESLETLTSAEPQSPLSFETSIERPPEETQTEQNEAEGVMGKFLRLLPWNNRSNLTVDALPCPSRPSSLGLPRSRVPSGAWSSGACPSSPVRTPVDEFNYSLLEGLFQRSTSATSGVSSVGAGGSVSRRNKWVRHIAGARSAQSQDCVALAKEQLLSRSLKLQAELCDSFSWLYAEDSEVVEEKESRCNTWPFFGMHMNHDTNNDSQLDFEEAKKARYKDHSDSIQGSSYQEENSNRKEDRNSIAELTEWQIPYDELDFGDCVLKGWNIQTYKGRWHGEVMIHRYKEESLSRFYQDVHNLTKIRHENVALFMGACTDPTQLSIVTSIRNGDSLYDAIHIKQKRLSHHSKVNIARQIAQGLGYLHAKKIVLKCLNSKSVFLECKVKICMVDYSGPVKKSLLDTLPIAGGAMCRGHMTYLSPELMATMQIEPPSFSLDPEIHSKHSDVYAFGTVLYELYAGKFPLSDRMPEAVIWLIGNGQRQDVDHLSCHVAMKSLIEDCWSPDPTYRPSFSQILKELQQTAALHKKHSSSEPEKLNRTGLTRSPYHFHRFGPIAH